MTRIRTLKRRRFHLDMERACIDAGLRPYLTQETKAKLVKLRRRHIQRTNQGDNACSE
jgi:hypothetical protein